MKRAYIRRPWSGKHEATIGKDEDGSHMNTREADEIVKADRRFVGNQQQLDRYLKTGPRIRTGYRKQHLGQQTIHGGQAASG
ncbi:hypothetical protein D3C73_1446110 [compost metagenome]